MKRVPGRDTRPAYSDKRRTWYGFGTLTRAKKSPFGQYLHDIMYVFSELSVLGLPAIMLAFMYPDPSAYGVTSAVLITWLTMTTVGAGIRGGWVPPLGTEIRGWVSLAPSLIVLRLLYYNAVIAILSFGSPWLAEFLSFEPLTIVFAFVGSLLAVLVFPRLGESVYHTLSGE